METNLDKVYNPQKVEETIYDEWEKSGYFKACPDESKKPFTIVMPPPNITGKLHMGHALDQTMQDIIIRFKRMQGYCALWVPGTDHASIATEAKIVEEMRKEGISKEDIGREKFLKRAYEWKEKYGSNIVKQLRKLGSSCDWSRERFTMDVGCSEAVKEFFVRLYEKGFIYRGERIINWCPKCGTSISDSEVNFKESEGNFWYINYKVLDSDEVVTVATTRPETMFGDVALAVNPNDERYKHLIGKSAVVPVIGRKIPIIGDDYVDIALGTGVLKITPAHDPNDFEVGLRHNLPVINVMNEKGIMNERCTFCSGLDRYEARKKLVARLSEEKCLHHVESIKHNVGTCYRCSSVVEPRVSTQWFVKMKELAKPAVMCVKNKTTEFIPDRFSKIYFHWMENIKDWCISRQLWWGHRIPAWYCKDCGKITVSKNDVKKCSHCGSDNIFQEEDTLDTWFSSALWPFSVLGWPKVTRDLKYFYPTDVLVTGYDIIFFWVAKMIFSSLEVMKKPPFKHVLIHGLVRDSQGRKMSKSLGNGVDPLEIIEKYGADALRFSLMLGNSPGNDMRFFYEKVESSRNFANKIWNAARFVHMSTDGKNLECTLSENLETIDKWIVSRFNVLVKDVTLNLEKFELGIAAQKIYDFIWDELCDWYIEFSKISGKKETLLWVINNTLKLLHPFMPFITEKIWKSFSHNSSSVMISEYPVCDEKCIDEVAEKDVNILISVVRSIRNLRREMNVSHDKHPVVYVEENLLCDVLKRYKDVVCRLAGVKDIKIDKNIRAEGTVTAVNDYVKLYLPIDELIDRDVEIKRLKSELDTATKQLEQARARLNNENFVSRAPKNVVDGARKLALKLSEKVSGLKSEIAKLK